MILLYKYSLFLNVLSRSLPKHSLNYHHHISLWMMKGVYLLVLRVPTDKQISTGRLGSTCFTKGFYVYVGSALNGLHQRIQRHMRHQKNIHWHIDYLLQHAEITHVFYKATELPEECILAKTLEQTFSSIPGFGCSDCTCQSHLFSGPQRDVLQFIERLGLQPYMMRAKS